MARPRLSQMGRAIGGRFQGGSVYQATEMVAPVTPVTAVALRESTAAARADLRGPHWDLAGMLPMVGDDVRSVQAVSVTVDDLAVFTGRLDSGVLATNQRRMRTRRLRRRRDGLLP